MIGGRCWRNWRRWHERNGPSGLGCRRPRAAARLGDGLRGRTAHLRRRSRVRRHRRERGAAGRGRAGGAGRRHTARRGRGDPIDAPAWTRALAALETAAPDGSDGLDGSPVDLRILLFCAFRHDMGGDAGLWTRLLDDPPEEIDGQWRAISARDLYEAGYAPQGAPEPPIQHLEPCGDAGDPAWGEVYLKLVGGAE